MADTSGTADESRHWYGLEQGGSMRSATLCRYVLGGLLCVSGCNGARTAFTNRTTERPERPQASLSLLTHAESPFGKDDTTTPQRSLSDSPGVVEKTARSVGVDKSRAMSAFPRLAHPQTSSNVAHSDNNPGSEEHSSDSSFSDTSRSEVIGADEEALCVIPVGYEFAGTTENGGTISIDGRTFQIRLIGDDTFADSPNSSPDRSLRFATLADVTTAESQRGVSVSSGKHFRKASHRPQQRSVPNVPPVAEGSTDATPNATLMNLPTALSMVGGNHPAVGLAQWKVQEAYADLDSAETLWLPSLRVGLSVHKHDGNYQASNGDIVDVNRSSMQFGLGAGATGADLPVLHRDPLWPGLADAVFAPEIAQKTAWATCHAEKAVVNRQLRDVAFAYVDLLNAHQRLRILQEIKNRTNGLAKITTDFAAAGQGLQADADRMQTELKLIEGRIAESRENVDVTSARLAQAVSTDNRQRIIPMDPTIAPIDLVPVSLDEGALISSGLAARPELKELQALVAAACNRYERQKYSPFVPSVLLGLSAGGFGGDTGNAINRVDDRYDFDAMVTWEIRNLGFGERSARRRSEAQVQQAMFRKMKLIDDVAREISEAYTQVVHRRDRMAITQQSIQTAMDSYERNLIRIRDGEGLPIEVMLSVKALEAAQLAYLDSVVAFNQAQFQLQWALGWQVSAPAEQG